MLIELHVTSIRVRRVAILATHSGARNPTSTAAACSDALDGATPHARTEGAGSPSRDHARASSRLYFFCVFFEGIRVFSQVSMRSRIDVYRNQATRRLPTRDISNRRTHIFVELQHFFIGQGTDDQLVRTSVQREPREGGKHLASEAGAAQRRDDLEVVQPSCGTRREPEVPSAGSEKRSDGEGLRAHALDAVASLPQHLAPVPPMRVSRPASRLPFPDRHIRVGDGRRVKCGAWPGSREVPGAHWHVGAPRVALPPHGSGHGSVVALAWSNRYGFSTSTSMWWSTEQARGARHPHRGLLSGPEQRGGEGRELNLLALPGFRWA